MTTDIENQPIKQKTNKQETDKQAHYTKITHYQTLAFIFTVITLISLMATLFYDDKIHHYDKFERVHGVHQTNFTFTGNYTIITTYDNYDNLVYNVNCISHTHHYGNCEYLYYSTNNYYDIDSQLETFCTEGVKIDGYISTETEKCTVDNPNRSIHKLFVRVKIFAIIGMSSGTCLFLCCFLHFRTINKN